MDRNAPVPRSFYDSFSNTFVLPEAGILTSIKAAHDRAHVTNTQGATGSPLLQYAAAGNATATPLPNNNSSLRRRQYTPPLRRLDGSKGTFGDQVLFDGFVYRWHGRAWVLYVSNGREGTTSYPNFSSQFLVSGDGAAAIAGSSQDSEREFGEGLSSDSLQADDDALIKAVGQWQVELRDEIWVFQNGFWQKDAELFKAIEKASWDNVILDSEMKRTLQNDAARFFDGREKYTRLGVPWKRGVIFYGPPGNGKTISIKALMHTLYHRKTVVPTLYVRSLSSINGPEYSIQQIFLKARQNAPCLLVFEDLDSLVTPQVRSFFLNEVDGLAANDGIYMLGSTNHLELLDPGISKRPSRFDRKYEFSKPNTHERTLYCEFWRRKVLRERAGRESDDEDSEWEKDFEELSVTGGGDNQPSIDFPNALCPKMADITGGFSFAYMQEAFIATLLSLASEEEEEEEQKDSDKDLESLKLWKEFKSQVHSLRKEIS